MANIAPTAIVDETAKLGKDVIVGPGCVISPGVSIGEGCELKANVMVAEGVTLGLNNRIFSNVILGEEPQIIGLKEPPTELIIGDDNVFRETVAINRGSPDGGGKTVIGNKNYFMIGSHLGHDCQVEDNVVIGNYTQISGHCKIERNVWMSAFSGTHQFVTVGCFSYAGGQSGSSYDIPPFMRVSGSYPCEVRGLNVIGLRRAGFAEESIEALNKVYRRLYRRRGAGSLAGTVDELLGQNQLDDKVKYLLEFLNRSFKHRMGRYLEIFRH